MKSLEVSEQKANNRVEEFKIENEQISDRLKQAEARAENAEKLVKRLQKTVDRLEGKKITFITFNFINKISFKLKLVFWLQFN